MTLLILGWQLPKQTETQFVEKVCEEIRERYQKFFHDELLMDGIVDSQLGLIAFGGDHSLDSHTSRDRDRFVCLAGSPTLAEHGNASRLDAEGLDRLLRDPQDGIRVDRIARVNPPFTVARIDNAGSLDLVHDGLGFDSFFIYESGSNVVFSNKCWPILRMMGHSPEMDPNAWKMWFSFGWFPQLLTPFKNIRFLGRGEIVRCHHCEVRRSYCGAMAEWIVSGREEERIDLLRRAKESFFGLIRMNGDEKCGADLTGGIDSRAICAALIREEIPAQYYTSGPADSHDVKIAKQIATLYDLDWEHVDPFSKGQMSPVEVVDRFTRMLQWDEGLVEPNRFQTFETKPITDRREYYVSGGVSELSKGNYYPKAGHDSPATGEIAVDLLKGRFVPRAMQVLASAQPVVEQLEALPDHTSEFGLTGYELTDYFYLDERVRRWSSAHTALDLLNRDVQPFLNVDHIKLAFSLSSSNKRERLFQRELILDSAPKLVDLAVPKTHVSGTTQHWPEFFRSQPQLIDHALRTASDEMGAVLEPAKVRSKLANFINGTDEDLYFVLRLIAFATWCNEFLRNWKC